MPKTAKPDKLAQLCKGLELTWNRARRCWKKKYKGKQYYLSGAGECPEPGKPGWKEGYERALLKWLDKKQKLERTLGIVTTLEKWEVGRPPAATVEQPADPVAAAAMATHWGLLPDTLPDAVATASKATTVAQVVDIYLAERRAEVDHGERVEGTYAEARVNLDEFRKFTARYAKDQMADLDEHLLRYYRNQILTLPPIVGKDGEAGKPMSAHTAKKRLRHVRCFMEWAYREAYLERLPRNIDTKYAAITLPDPEPNPFTRKEVRELFGAASRRTKLYVALGINCGYRQKDIATLLHEHVAWDEPAIHRKRSKTGSPQHHKLWGVTATLLREFATDPQEHERVLVDATGKPLVVEHDDGSAYRKTNPIGSAVQRAIRKLGWPFGSVMERLRDTGAQTLTDQYPGQRYIVKQYLGHKDRDVVRHYCDANYRDLWAALDWMEGYFDLAKLLDGDAEAEEDEE